MLSELAEFIAILRNFTFIIIGQHNNIYAKWTNNKIIIATYEHTTTIYKLKVDNRINIKQFYEMSNKSVVTAAARNNIVEEKVGSGGSAAREMDDPDLHMAIELSRFDPNYFIQRLLFH